MVLSSFSMSWGDGTELLALCADCRYSSPPSTTTTTMAVVAPPPLPLVLEESTMHTHYTYKKCRADIIHSGLYIYCCINHYNTFYHLTLQSRYVTLEQLTFC
jgi:hypothetical protein